MRLQSLLKRVFRRPLVPAAVLSLCVHLLLVLLAAEREEARLAKTQKEEKREVARINLQVTALAPAAAAPAIQIFREDLFKDTTDEEKKLFKLRKTEDARRRVAVDQDRNLRDLLQPGPAGGRVAGATNSVVPFYSLDTLPRPREDYLSRISFPDQAAALGISEFSIVVELVIDEKGALVSSRLVTSGEYGFGDAVLKGLEGVRFFPGKVQGRAVRSLLRERILFTGGQ